MTEENRQSVLQGLLQERSNILYNINRVQSNEYKLYLRLYQLNEAIDKIKLEIQEEN